MSGILGTLCTALDGGLSGSLFTRTTATVQAGDGRFDRWTRDLSWKRDVVELFYRRGRTEVVVSVYVEVPHAGRYIGIDGTTVSYLAGPDTGYRLPRGLFRSFKLRRLASRLVRDTQKALDWFDQYESPSTTLARLQSPERNGCAIGTPAHRLVLESLEHVAGEYPSRRELTEAFVRAVPDAFEPLARRHGLVLGAIEPRLFALESSATRALVRFGSGHLPDINVLVGPASGPAPQYDDLGSEVFGLAVILEGLGASETYAPEPLHTLADVAREVRRGAGLLEQWCGPILRGDFSLWPTLHRRLERR